MNQNTIPNPQFELPRPQTSGQENLTPAEADPNLGQATERSNMEQAAAAAPVDPTQAAQSVQAAAQATAPGSSPIPGIIPATPPASVIDDTMLAEDGDLIEKVWVQKAKEIVERTRNDPYTQNREINKVKKDYIQKRYQKDVKLTDE